MVRTMYLIYIVSILVSCRRASDNSVAGTLEERRTTTNSVGGTDLNVSNPSVALLAQWDLSSISKSGDDRQATREAVLLTAVQTLSGQSMGDFIVGLHERRENQAVNWLIDNGMKAMFMNSEAVKVREWLTRLEDDEFKYLLHFQAGYWFTGPGIKEYLVLTATGYLQDRVLTGYCCRLAESEPLRALTEFSELRPKSVSYVGLKEIVRHMPEGTEFEKVSARYPTDFDKANSLARGIRAELLRRWAEFHPDRAAAFVFASPAIVAPEQMEVVVAKWAGTEPDAAGEWLNKAPAGKARDSGFEVLAKHWTGGDPAKAWQYAASLSDFDKRVAVATEVFRAWEKTDRAAAEKAWVELFPGQ